MEFLWLRALEINIGGATPEAWAAFLWELDALFERYRSLLKA